MVDIKYTQNFYKNKTNLERVIKLANIDTNDLVLDIGAGTGIITEELSKYAKKVIAYELDKRYFDKIKSKTNVILKNEDFLNTELPKENFKVFSNIPFSITSDIVFKLTNSGSKLIEAYLFVQKESAQRYIGELVNTQIATILSYKYDINILEEFKSGDFKPVPSVDIVLLKIKRKQNIEREFELYRDFVSYIFNQMNSDVLDTFKKLFTFKQLKYITEYVKRNRYRTPSDIPSEYYLEIFQYFKSNGGSYKGKVNGYYLEHLNRHSKMEKRHRATI